MQYSRASAAPFSLAATAVLTLALVAAYIPINPAMPEHNDPSKKKQQFAILKKNKELKYKLSKK